MAEPTETDVVTRARQLFEMKTARQWDDKSSTRNGAAPAPGATDAEKASYMEEARKELRSVEEEGHS